MRVRIAHDLAAFGCDAPRVFRLQPDELPASRAHVVGATEPAHIARLRELMPSSIFLLPGVGAQGGDPKLLGAAFAPGPAAAIVSSSRGIAGAPDPAAAAEDLRATLWAISNA